MNVPLELTGLTKVFPIHSSVADAVSAPAE